MKQYEIVDKLQEILNKLEIINFENYREGEEVRKSISDLSDKIEEENEEVF